MENYNNNNELMVEEEVYVTNGAIKATDVLGCIAAGAFALTGLTCLYKAVQTKKQRKVNEDTKASVLAQMIKDGCTPEQIQNASELMDKFM